MKLKGVFPCKWDENKIDESLDFPAVPARQGWCHPHFPATVLCFKGSYLTLWKDSGLNLTLKKRDSENSVM